MARETKVQKLDRKIAPHRERGDNVLVATAKAVRDIRREQAKGGK